MTPDEYPDFVAVLQGGDAYLLFSILHDWDDDHAIQILPACCQAMRPEATLLAVEQVITSGAPPSPVPAGGHAVDRQARSGPLSGR